MLEAEHCEFSALGESVCAVRQLWYRHSVRLCLKASDFQFHMHREEIWPWCPDILGTNSKQWRSGISFSEVSGLISALLWLHQKKSWSAALFVGRGLEQGRASGDLSPALSFHIRPTTTTCRMFPTGYRCLTGVLVGIFETPGHSSTSVNMQLIHCLLAGSWIYP